MSVPFTVVMGILEFSQWATSGARPLLAEFSAYPHLVVNTSWLRNNWATHIPAVGLAQWYVNYGSGLDNWGIRI